MEENHPLEIKTPPQTSISPNFEEEKMTSNQIKAKGKQLVSEHKWSDAFLIYTKLLSSPNASEEDLAIGLSNRSHVLYMMEKYEEAKNDGIRCCKLRPKWAKGYMRTGYAFLGLNDITKAVTYFKGGMGKEGDDGFMKKKLNELFLDINAPNKILKNNYYFTELKEFKENYFSNPEKSDEIYEKLAEKRGKVNNNNELEKVLEEINQIITKTWNFKNTAEMFEKDKKFYLANCCYKTEFDLSDGKKKKEMMDLIKRNCEKEEQVFPAKRINKLALSRNPNFKHSIDLKIVVDIFHTYLIENFYNGDQVSFYNYFLQDVKSGENDWFLSRNLKEKSTPETFYINAESKKKSIDFYWKFFTMNTASFFNGGLANLIDDLIRQSIYPFFQYKNAKTKQTEQVNVFYSTTMDAIVMKSFKNPTVYYAEKDAYFKMLKGKRLEKPFLNADSGHPLICLITDKVVYEKRLYLLIDLTAAQYDLFEYNEKGYPYYEKTMLAGDCNVEGNFYVGNCAQTIETHVEPMVKEDKKFQYFPLKVWTNAITETCRDVKKVLGIAKPEDD